MLTLRGHAPQAKKSEDFAGATAESRRRRGAKGVKVRGVLLLSVLVVFFVGCDGCGRDTGSRAGAGGGRSTSASAVGSSTVPASSGPRSPGTVSGPSPEAGPAVEVMPEPRCAPEMVRVGKRFCIDRYEAMLVDANSGERISPYYSPSRKLALFSAKKWGKKRLQVGDAKARAMPLPRLPAWQQQRDPVPKAVARKLVVPNGYVTGKMAEVACRNAGKRLCSLEEWTTACQGQQNRKFPYGDKFVRTRCNVFRYAHPATILHDDASRGHSDPRLNLVKAKGRPLLRKTGVTETCRSEWEDDAVMDMVGNLDEWVDDPDGTFVGGFYARSTKEGCEKRISAHGYNYADYSTGVRCCADLPQVGE